MKNLKKLGNNPMKKNSSSSKGVQVLTQHIGISARFFCNSTYIFSYFQKDNYDSLIGFFLLCSSSDLYIYLLYIYII